MVRTQIQLTEEQARQAKRAAAKHGISVAEVIRRSLDRTLPAQESPSEDELWDRMMASAGRFHSGLRDVSERVDDYLDQAYSK